MEPHYELEVSTGNLSWDYCTAPAESGAFTVVTGSRVLDEAELASVLRPYGNLELDASGPCDAMSIPTSEYGASVIVEDDPWYLDLVDEGFSCSAESSGIYAIGIPALARIIDSLVR
ncbi:MAG: hypothetical protein JW940_36825 [Polyangiaceae bacterium]|nr:hypothetical protein [Polyangiaceae bacterium]